MATDALPASHIISGNDALPHGRLSPMRRMLDVIIRVQTRRALARTGRSISMIADALDEAIAQSDAARRKYPFVS